ncbi:nuclear transport factor 2 family protein [Sinorhizobium fredii]|uniref:nuclear transport factor 2 family protein n=1 Tax=Rhizobium fredii TaxID=380 RepID=UPI000BC00278|nr:nuclear transport factor 2 family protein [Sinorhizobium fredii]ASY72589.1 hypothetical protein SF83666_b59400 [Sinorhizobium fredii CCBAU 83666]
MPGPEGLDGKRSRQRRSGDPLSYCAPVQKHQLAGRENAGLAAFEKDFLPEAALYASARPLRSQTTGQFIERMNGLVGKTLHSLEETILGSRIHVFGNVAVAVIACENVENATETNRNVEMMLLVKDDGSWRVAAQAWDRQDAANPVTSELWER